MIGFLDGIDVLGAIDREKKRVEDRVEERRKKNVQCRMHEHVTCKKKLHHEQKPNPNYSTHKR